MVRKKVVVGVLVTLLTLSLATSSVFAATKKAGSKAGIEGFFNSCILGPRIGIEMNDGQSVSTMEYLQYISLVPVVGIVGVIPRVILAAEAGNKNGVKGFLTGCFIGPRVGMELDSRKIRVVEWVRLVPIVGIVPAVINGVEAYQGKTMKEIEATENLKKGSRGKKRRKRRKRKK